MGKRCLSVLLALCLCLSMVPAGMVAAEEENDVLVGEISEDLNGGAEATEDRSQVSAGEAEAAGDQTEALDDKAEASDEREEAAEDMQIMPLDDSKYSGGDGSADNPYKISTAQDMWDLSENDGDWDKNFVLTQNINLQDISTDSWSPIGAIDNVFSGTFDGGDKTISGLYINNTRDYQGLFGYVTDGNIIKLHVDGYISAGGHVGGIVGAFFPKNTDSRIENCSFNGTIGGYGSDDSDLAIGGIVGHNHGGKVIGCHFNGTVDQITMYVGGIVGQNENSSAIIENCYNEGTVIISGASATEAGGIAGTNISGAQIVNCYNNGSVIGSGSAGLIGGIVGYNNGGIVERCYNISAVEGTADSNIGGIAGTNTSDATIKECYNSGAVSGATFIGGITGQNDFSSVVNNCYNEADVRGTSYVGGIVGRNHNGTNSNKVKVGTVTNSYNRGKVSGNNSNSGGIVGVNSNNNNTGAGTVTNCYYLTDTANGGIAGSNVAGQAEVKTTEEFASGEVAWLLQHVQNGQGLIWGQELVTSPTDPYPLLVNIEKARTTPRAVRRVVRVTFKTAANSSYQVSYTNEGGSVGLPENPDVDDKHIFHEWRVGNISGRAFASDSNTIGSDDVTIDEVTIVAVQREKYAGDQNIELHEVYSTKEQKIAVDLDNYMSYADGANTAGKFTYQIKEDGKNTWNAELTSDGITVPARTDAGTYTLTVTAHEEEPQISTFSLGNYDTVDVDLSITVIIDKATPDLSELAATGIKYGESLKDSTLSGKATYEEQDVKGELKWETDSIEPSVSDSDSTEYNVVFYPEDDKNYNSVTGKVTLTVEKADPTDVKAPEPKDLTYNGKAQELIEKGSATGGEMQYALSEEGPYSATIPSYANAGTYRVWYKVVGDENHKDTEPAYVEATIHKAPLKISEQSFTYNGSNTLTITANGVELSSGDFEKVTVILTAASENVDEYEYNAVGGDRTYTAVIAAPDDNNYTIDDKSEKLTINKLTAILAWKQPLVFFHDGTPKTVTAYVSNAVRDTDQFELEYDGTNTETEVGQYEATVSSVGNLNYELDLSSASVKWRILPENSHVEMKAEDVTYGETLEVTVTVKSDPNTVRALAASEDTIDLYVNDNYFSSQAVIVENGEGVVTFSVPATSEYYVSAGANKLRAEYGGSADESLSGGTGAVSVNVDPKPIKASIEEEITKIYDGNDYVTTEVSLTLNGVEGCDKDDVSAAANQYQYDRNDVNATSVTGKGVTLSGIRSGNYTLEDTDVEGSGRISPKPVGLVWHDYENLIYDGTEKDVHATTNELVRNDKCNVTTVKDGQMTDAGDYEAVAEELDNSNYTLPVERTQPYTIAPAKITIPEKSYPYNGDNEFTVTLDGVTKENGATEKVEVILTANSADAGKYAYSGTDETDETDKYTAKIQSEPENKNYEIIAGETLTIEKIDPVFTAPEAINGTYIGTAQNLITKGNAEGGEMQYSLDMSGEYSRDIPTGTTVGQYQVWYQIIGDKNHNDLGPEAITAKINPAELDISETTVIYDGSTVFTVELSGQGKEKVTATITTSSPNAGDYTAGTGNNSYTVVLSNSNYVVGDSQKFTILPKEVRVIWSGYDGLVYTGNPSDVTATVDGLVGDDTCEIQEITGGKKTNAGEYTAEASGLTNPNYKLPDDPSLEYTIKPAELTIPAQNYTYTGNKEFTVTLDGVTPENGTTEKVEVILTAYSANVGEYEYDEETKASRYTAEIQGELDNKNYIIVTGETLTIEKADPIFTEPTAINSTYNGTAQDLIREGSTGDGAIRYRIGTSGDYAEAIPQETEAGEYQIWYQIKGDGNHKDIEQGPLTATIYPAKLDIPEQSFTYNGQTAFTVDLPSVNGETVTVTMTAAAKDAASYTYAADSGTGKYTAALSSKNYTIGNAQILKIEPKEVELVWDGYTDLVYNGQPVKVTAAVSAGDLIEGDTCTVTVEDGDMINADTYTAKAIELSNKNYKLPSPAEQVYTIKPAELTIPAQTVKYNGTSTFTVNDVETGVNNETITVVYTTTSPDVGTYTYQAADTVAAIADTDQDTGNGTYTAETQNNSNYKIVDGQALEITPADPTYTPPTPKGGKYTGSELELITKGSAEGGKMLYSLSEEGPYSEEIPTRTDVGTYTVWYKVEGDSNHNDIAPQSVTASITTASSNNPGGSSGSGGSSSSDGTGNTSGGALSLSSVPQTADGNQIGLWVTLLILALAGVMTALYAQRKMRRAHSIK